jgi:hypothetical protein
MKMLTCVTEASKLSFNTVTIVYSYVLDRMPNGKAPDAA